MSSVVQLRNFLNIEGLDLFVSPGEAPPLIVLGVDPSWGKDDFSGMQGLDIRTARQVLEYQGKATPLDLFKKLQTICLHKEFFKVKMVIIEANAGRGLIDQYEVWKKEAPEELPMLYYERATSGHERRSGFIITSISRPLLLARFREVTNDEPAIIRSLRLLSEMQTFVEGPRGREQANYGFHDDLIFAYCLALKGRDDYLLYWAPYEILREQGTETAGDYPIPQRIGDFDEEDPLAELGIVNRRREVDFLWNNLDLVLRRQKQDSRQDKK